MLITAKKKKGQTMAKIEVTNSHVDEVIEALQSKRLKIIEEWGLLAEGYAKINCPVDTGRLRNSISHGKEDDSTMVVGTNVEYAPYVELGTSRMEARPFLAPSIDEHIAEYKEIAQEELKG